MPKRSPRIARVLRRNRERLSIGLMRSVQGWEKFRAAIGSTDTSAREFAGRELAAYIDYLALYFSTADATYLDLYGGEKRKQCYVAGDSLEDFAERCRGVMKSDEEAYCAILDGQLKATDIVALLDALTMVSGSLNVQATKPAKVLLVGDCLYLDVMCFLPGYLAKNGIHVRPTFVTSKSVAEITKALHSHQSDGFDLVFCSPFSYESQPEYSHLHSVRTSTKQEAYVRGVVESAKANTEKILRSLGNLYDCPVFIHDSANVPRHDGSFVERARNRLTRRNRHLARELINVWLPRVLAEMGEGADSHLRILRESSLLQRHTEYDLGRLFYKSELQHPAAFGRELAKIYSDIIAAQVLLSRKKVVVCDLDNTLWKGVVAEGPVEQYTSRQHALKTLKQKGMVLAINSKNEPQNVRWDEAHLGPEDFVSAQVNWNSKTSNLQRIAWELNLKTKDFIFLDDRADERELVNTAMPEVTVLNAESPAVWSQLEHLGELLRNQEEGDRTQLYLQRKRREDFLNEAGPLRQQTQSFGHLGIRVLVRPAVKKELRRVTELINRTNQFNLCGSRPSIHEVNELVCRSQMSDVRCGIGRQVRIDGYGVRTGCTRDRKLGGNPAVRFELSCFRLRNRTGLTELCKDMAARPNGCKHNSTPRSLPRDAAQRAMPGSVPRKRILLGWTILGVPW